MRGKKNILIKKNWSRYCCVVCFFFFSFSQNSSHFTVRVHFPFAICYLSLTVKFSSGSYPLLEQTIFSEHLFESNGFSAFLSNCCHFHDHLNNFRNRTMGGNDCLPNTVILYLRLGNLRMNLYQFVNMLFSQIIAKYRIDFYFIFFFSSIGNQSHIESVTLNMITILILSKCCLNNLYEKFFSRI